jgi:hypothetical protein
MRLGKLAPKIHPAAPPLMRLAGAMPALPDSVDWTGKLSGAPVFLNDTLGCCTIATMAHILRVWTSQVWGEELDVPDALVESTYFGLTGGADTGLPETDVLAFWASSGLSLPSRQFRSLLSGWCTLDIANQNHVRAAVAWFGSAYIGLALPIAAENAAVWDMVPGAGPSFQPGSWGGHAVPIAAYDPQGVTLITWGKLQRASWDFLAAYMDEAHGPVSRTWLQTSGHAPPGFDLAGLEAAMRELSA